jgi:hypothetical protein
MYQPQNVGLSGINQAHNTNLSGTQDTAARLGHQISAIVADAKASRGLA